MKTGSEFHVGIVGLGSMGMGAALSCVRAGLSTWGADLNSNACATLKEAGACGVSDNAATFAEKLDALLVLVRKKLLPLWLDSIWKCWMRQFLVVQ